MGFSVKVNNVPPDADRCIVARLDNGELWYWGSWSDKAKADEAAREFDNGVVVERNDMREQKIELIKIAEYYGYDAQSRQCIEEMAELTQSINKFWRVLMANGKFTLDELREQQTDNSRLSDKIEYKNLIEEIADVQITLCHMTYFLDADLLPIIEQKINRQLKRIGVKNRGD